MAEKDVEKLWKSFKRSHGSRRRRYRDRLVTHYLPLAVRAAQLVKARVPLFIDYQDILSAACTGLLNAVDKYDPEAGPSFPTFSRRRIHGAIADYLREVDWLPRMIRIRIRKLQAIIEEDFDGRIDVTRLAARAGLSEFKVQEALEIANVSFCSMPDNEEIETMPVFVDEKHSRHWNSVSVDMQAAIAELSETEQFVVKQFFIEGKLLREIGKELGVSESLACLVKQEAVNKMKRFFGVAIEEEDEADDAESE